MNFISKLRELGIKFAEGMLSHETTIQWLATGEDQ
jgi:hypothetical protein